MYLNVNSIVNHGNCKFYSYSFGVILTGSIYIHDPTSLAPLKIILLNWYCCLVFAVPLAVVVVFPVVVVVVVVVVHVLLLIPVVFVIVAVLVVTVVVVCGCRCCYPRCSLFSCFYSCCHCSR